MPVVLRVGPWKFFFYSNEGNPLKAPHIHVRGNGGEAKISLSAPFAVMESAGLSSRELREVQNIATSYVNTLLGAYNEYFS